MPKPIEPSLSWADAPDILTPKHLSQLLGVGIKKANEIFNSREFPLLSENVTKRGAYKYSVAKFLGIEIEKEKKETSRNEDMVKILQQILDTLNQKMNYRGEFR